ncbi:hypothetical protein GCM10023352_08390 [Rothia endophytica]|uniref:Uncharacterized protein n=1 Tax=Rothia endophytica TaxID=1324766 RepID=A0ABP9B969_9MICC
MILSLVYWQHYAQTWGSRKPRSTCVLRGFLVSLASSIGIDDIHADVVTIIDRVDHGTNTLSGAT